MQYIVVATYVRVSNINGIGRMRIAIVEVMSLAPLLIVLQYYCSFYIHFQC